MSSLAKRFSAALLLAPLALFGGEALLSTDFADGAPKELKLGPSAKAATDSEAFGHTALTASSMNSDKEFVDVFKTSLKLKGGAVYEAEFDYQILEQAGGGHLYALFDSPTATWMDASGGNSTFSEAGCFAHAKVVAPLTPVRDDFEFHLMLFGKAKVKISDFRLSRIELPAIISNDAKPKKSFAVTGANEFEIDKPRPEKAVELDASAFGVSPGSPDNTKAMAAAIEACKNRKASKLTLPKGTYRFDGYKKIAISFSNLQDFEFDANGSLFVFHSPDKSGSYVNIANCLRCVFKGVSLDWDFDKSPLSARMKTESFDKASREIKLSFPDYEDFPDKSVKFVRFILPVDNATLEPGRFNETGLDLDGIEWLSGNLVKSRVKNCGPGSSHPAPGDNYLAPFTSWSGQALYISNTSHALFKEVNVYSSPGFGYRIADSKSNYLVFDSCKATVNPEAKPRRLMSLNSDIMDMVSSAEGFFKIENCDFGYSGDDFINFNVSAYCGLKYAAGKKELIANTDYPDSSFRPGSTLEIRNYDFSPTGFRSKIAAREKVSENSVKVTLEDEVPQGLSALSVFFFPDCKMENVIIRGNRFHHGYCRGILPCGKNVTIEGNSFKGNCMPDLMIVNDPLTRYRIEGNGIANLLIKGNVFEDSNVFGTVNCAAAIWMPLWRPNTWHPITSGISIEGNKFVNPHGAALFTSSVNGLRFSGNSIVAKEKLPRPFLYRGCVVAGKCSSDFVVSGNIWDLEPGANAGVAILPDSTRGISVFDNARR